MKVLICDKLAADAVKAMTDAGIDVDNRPTITPEDLVHDAAHYDAVIVRSRTKVTKEVIDAAPKVKIVVRGGVGVDNIDTKAAAGKGVKVANTPKASTESVAELAVGFMLSLARKIPQASASMAKGEWKKKELEGTEIAGKTLGLIGVGRIGSRVANICSSAFGMRVLAYDPYVPKEKGPELGVTIVEDLGDLLAESDYISLHVPKTPETTNILNADAFAKMKPGAYVVNCGRGGTIDEDALYDALAAGNVAGAALDVYADEKINPGNAKLYSLKDKNGFNLVIGSPHIGAGTSEGQARVGGEVADILIAFYKDNF